MRMQNIFFKQKIQTWNNKTIKLGLAEIGLVGALASPIAFIIFAQFDNVIEVDENRNIDYSSSSIPKYRIPQ